MKQNVVFSGKSYFEGNKTLITEFSRICFVKRTCGSHIPVMPFGPCSPCSPCLPLLPEEPFSPLKKYGHTAYVNYQIFLLTRKKASSHTTYP